MATKTRTLESLLKEAVTSDAFEEDAMDYLEDHRIALYSHSRISIISQAWKAGWRPY
jgi:hypothetical protein